MKRKEKIHNFKIFWVDIQTNHKDQMDQVIILNSFKLRLVVFKDNSKGQINSTII